jgi:RHS repeat-associated protein
LLSALCLFCCGLACASLPHDSLERLDYTALVNKYGHVLDGYGYGYDYLGLRTGITRDLGLTNSSVTVGYDSIGQITSWSAREDLAGPLRLNEQAGWVYDAAGNLRYRTNGGLIQTFTADPVNQLANVARNSAMTVSGTTPVPASSVTVNGQTAQTYGDFTFAAANQSLFEGQNTFAIVAQKPGGGSVTNNLTANLPGSVTLLYDANGNLTNDGTRSFAYNAENQLTNITLDNTWKTEFVYDGLGRRRIERNYGWQAGQWAKTNETRYVYDGYLAIQERDSNNVPLVTYTRGLDLSGSLQGAGGIGGLLARTDGNGSMFYHADGAGNIAGLMDGQQNMAARYMYGPFGRLVGKWGPMADVNAMQFSSMPVHRQSGLIGYWGRAYDPNLQRWIQRDPIGEMGGINLYGFVGNSPLSWVDPWGRGLYTPGQAFQEPSSSNYSLEQLANATEADIFGPPTFVDMSAGYDPLAAGAPGSISFGGGGRFAVGDYSSPALAPGLQDIAGDLALMVAIGMATDGLGDLFLPEMEGLLAAKRLERCVAKGGVLADANFAQRTFSQAFSSEGAFAGRTVEDVAAALRSGQMGAADVPVQYIIRDGNALMLNTRSAQALEAAGIPRGQWNAINVTGDAAAEARLTGQLQRNGLGSQGTPTVTPGKR